MMSTDEIRLSIIAGKQFVIALEPEDGGGFHVYCPELRGCHAFGETQEDAVENIAQAIGQYLNEMVARYGQNDGIVIIPGENIFPETGRVPEKTLRAIVADLGMTVEEFAALADQQPQAQE
jgi:predicted RNase H-like HicB family nuclease